VGAPWRSYALTRLLFAPHLPPIVYRKAVEMV